MKMIARVALPVVLVCLAGAASAQPMRYPVKSMDFDIWCTEVQHIAWQRCDKRLPEDMEKFEKYRDTVERYEIPYLKEKDSTLRFDESILRNDPVDKRPDSTLPKPPGALDGGDK